MQNKKEQGFSLLESIVALVVLSLVFISSWDWFSTASKSTVSIEHAIALPAILPQLNSQLELESMFETRQGLLIINGYSVEWDASPIKSSDNQEIRKQPAWVVVLFKLNIKVSKGDRLISTFVTHMLKQYPDPNFVDIDGLQ